MYLMSMILLPQADWGGGGRDGDGHSVSGCTLTLKSVFSPYNPLRISLYILIFCMKLVPFSRFPVSASLLFPFSAFLPFLFLSFAILQFSPFPVFYFSTSLFPNYSSFLVYYFSHFPIFRFFSFFSFLVFTFSRSLVLPFSRLQFDCFSLFLVSGVPEVLCFFVLVYIPHAFTPHPPAQHTVLWATIHRSPPIISAKIRVPASPSSAAAGFPLEFRGTLFKRRRREVATPPKQKPTIQTK